MRKRLAIMAAVAFVAFGALWTYVQSESFGRRIRPLVLGPLQEVLGPGAVIGRIKANLLPLSLEVRDIVIPTEGNANAVAIRRVRVYINPLPLLYRSLSVPSLTILEPRMTAERDADGTIDLERLVRSIRENIARRGGTGGPAYEVHLRTITIRNGTFVLLVPGEGLRVEAARVNAKARLSFPRFAGDLRIASGTITATAPSYPRVAASIQGAASYEQGMIAVRSLELRSEGSRVSFTGSAGTGPDGPLDLDLKARMGKGALGRLVANILKRDRRAREPVMEASATVRGTLADPVVDGKLSVADLPLRTFQLRSADIRFTLRDRIIELEGGAWRFRKGEREGTLNEVRLRAAYRRGGLESVTALVRAEDAEVSAAGTVNPASGLDLTLSGELSGNGAVITFLTGVAASGDAKVRGTVSGPLADPRFDGTLNAGPVVVRNVPFQSVAGLLSYRERTLSLVGATIEQGESRYLLDGSVDLSGAQPRYRARLGVIRSDVVGIVALFYKRIPLDMRAAGELTFEGTATDFTGAGRIDLGPGSAYGETFDRAVVTAELSSTRVSFPRVVVDKAGGTVSGRGWIAFDRTYGANVTARGIDLSRVDRIRGLMLSGPFLLDIESSGSFRQPVVRARAESGALSFKKAELGDAFCLLEIGNGEMHVMAAVEGEREVTAGINSSMRLSAPYPWTMNGSLRVTDADPAALSGMGAILSRFRVSSEGDMNFRGTGFAPERISGRFIFSRFALVLGDHRIENDGQTVLGYEQGRFRAERMYLAGEGTRLSLTGSARPGTDVDLDFAGDVNLSLLRVLYREVEHGDGIASVRLSVDHAWASPDVEGELVVRDGVVKVRDIPQRFTALNGRILFGRGRIVTEGLTAEVGGGTVAVNGSAELKGSSLREFSTRATVDNVSVRYPAGMTALVGGTLYYDGDPEAQALSGELALRKARYEKRIEWKSMLVDFSRGVTQRRKADIGWIGETQLNVRITGSDDVLFESNLAKIPLSVDLLFRGTVNQPQLLGRIEARKGEVYFRNNVFRILYASADLVDPLRLNPVLDVQAETRVREYRIRLAVTGNADRAVVTFLSDPALPDADILALLALGRRGEELKGKEANIGVGEATSFATGKFQDLLESRARSITGLDRFQVDPYINKQDTAVPRVTVGKEVVPDRFHVTYSSNVGGTTPEQNARVEYFLNRNISLIGEYDELGQIGADVKFRFEFR